MNKRFFCLALLFQTFAVAQYSSTPNNVYHSDIEGLHDWWDFDDDDFVLSLSAIDDLDINTEICGNQECDTLFVGDFNFEGIANHEICNFKLEMTKKTSGSPFTDGHIVFRYNGEIISDNLANLTDLWTETYETSSYTISTADFYIPITPEVVNDPSFEISIVPALPEFFCVGVYLNNVILHIEDTPMTITDTRYACDSLLWFDGLIYYSDNNATTYLSLSNTACDTIYQLNLTIGSIHPEVNLNGAYLTASLDELNYQWLDCNNDYAVVPSATSQDFLPPANGNYAVETINGNCIDTSACIAYTTFDIDEIHNKPIRISPNPSSGNINIDLENLQDVKLSLYSINGQLLFHKENTNTAMLNLDLEVDAGIYFMTIQHQNKRETHKLVVQ